MELIAQIFGIIAFAFAILSSQQRSKIDILFFLFISELFWALNFAFLGADVGMIICIISVSEVAINYLLTKKKIKNPKWLTLFFFIASVICGIMVVETPYDLLPLLSIALYPLELGQRRSKNIRRLSIVSISLWIIYDAAVGAYSGVFADIVELFALFSAIRRFDRRRRFVLLKVFSKSIVLTGYLVTGVCIELVSTSFKLIPTFGLGKKPRKRWQLNPMAIFEK